MVRWILFFLLIGAGLLVFFWSARDAAPDSTPPLSEVAAPASESPLPTVTGEGDQSGRGFVWPLENASERVIKKMFGTFITPETSPVQPERFRGYHTGADFETFPEEAETDVVIRAVCTGPVAVKRTASGYGGVLVQRCTYENEPITVIYGHMRLASIVSAIGDSITAGDTIGVLGTGDSAETDGERKHLHLSIHKGAGIDIRGYVASQSLLDQWLDPCQLLNLAGACSL